MESAQSRTAMGTEAIIPRDAHQLGPLLAVWPVADEDVVRFFVLRGSDKKAAVQENGDLVGAIWTDASEHVVHLSMARTPEDAFRIEGADYSDLRIGMSTRQILTLLEAFPSSSDVRLRRAQKGMADSLVAARRYWPEPSQLD